MPSEFKDLCPDMVKYIHDFCKDRTDRMGLHSLKSGACKSCPYRYRGKKTDIYCCTFGTLPRDWEFDAE